MQPTFLYHALATGISGQITLPFQQVIEVKAPSALPFTGGHSSSRTEHYSFKDIMSFAAASTMTTGSESDNSFHTVATATIEGLNILDVVKADRVVARVASKYAKGNGARSVTFAGSLIENLRIGGHPLDVVIDPGQMKAARRTDRAQLGTCVTPINLKGAFGLEQLPDGGIHVPEFGKVYLLESLITSHYQTLSMLRVELGCAVEGHFAAAHASTNGEPMPGLG